MEWSLLSGCIRKKWNVLRKGVSNAAGRNPDAEISPPRVTIKSLPDEILLEIFNFCRVASMKAPHLWSGRWANTWHQLVHVCQRWRYVVFSSPLGLYLRLYCTDRTSVRNMLNVWPPFPIDIISHHLEDNIMAALEHRDRVCNLGLYPSSYSNFERLVTVMRDPLPALLQLRLVGRGAFDRVPVLPVTFLGGSAPNLLSLTLDNVAFPTLPQLLLSCKDLSELCLHNIPYLGYISPEALAIGLSSLTRLTSLMIEFKKEETGTIRDLPKSLPLTHAHLPALTTFHFRGLNEYLEDLVARIDTPQIKILFIKFFLQPVFDIRQFISHSQSLGPFDRAKVEFDHSTVLIQLAQSEGAAPSIMELEIGQHAPGQRLRLSSLVQICTQSSSLLSSVTELNIIDSPSFSAFIDRMNNPQWLVLFDSFTAARTLRLSGEIQWSIIYLLGGLTRESATKVLPKLQNLYLRKMDWRDQLEEPFLEKFIAARQHSDHPVTWGFDG
ncbi:hypothetical protein BGW80DRAFT_1559565 [Lactifluus volemus]|nr:hypothetical protein BGW80DRAFT_1559565 [Lactifluus volemus]